MPLPACVPNASGVTSGYAWRRTAYARTYSDVRAGQGFWYENANGLVEIAVSQARASDRLRIAVGDSIGMYDA